MKFSDRWLREWVDPPLSATELADRLTLAGVEVEGVEPVAGAMSGVVVGEIESVEAHPHADRLSVCRVRTGKGEPLSVVCGAPNARAGLRAPLAKVGASLPENRRIEANEVRGVQSQGMLCSAAELALSDDAGGLLELSPEAPLGEDLSTALGLEDMSIELELTPNRADCLGLRGIAREVAALTDIPVTGPALQPVSAAIDDSFPVELQAPEDCPRYVGRVIRGLDPSAPSPLWLTERLRRSGLRSISALVDVTNYVMLELGQPLHAFDLAKLRDGIVVRRARDGERITLLDGREVALSDEYLLITDGSGPVAIAGVMGGEESGVTEDTTDVFLESAYFRPATIMGKARELGMHTDASHRFERGVDPELQALAAERATELLVAIAGGQPGPLVEAAEREHLPRAQAVNLRSQRLTKVLGVEVPGATVERILTRLGMEVRQMDGGWSVTPPSSRFDIAIEEDLIEEVARVHGYERIPERLPRGRLSPTVRSEASVSQARLRAALADRGYREAITYSFVDRELLEAMHMADGALPLANPLSADMGVMRTALTPGLLQALVHNRHHQRARVRLFEIGDYYRREGEETREGTRIAGVAAGPAYPEQWGLPARDIDFYDLKADVEALIGLTGAAHEVAFEPEARPWLHPGRAASVRRDGVPVGWLGQLHPKVAERLDAPAEVYAFELDLAQLSRRRVPSFEAVSRYPSIRRDLAIIVAESVAAGAVRECIAAEAGELLQDLVVFDHYTGQGIEPGTKSLGVGLILRHASRTLTDEEVDTLVQRIITRLNEELSASLRE